MTEKLYKTDEGTEFRVAAEALEGRVFIGVHGLMVDVHITADGVGVSISHGNEVVAECTADHPEA